MIFDRKKYLNELVSAEGNGMIKLITGIRRSGKSFLLFEIYKRNLLERGISEDHIIEVNLEDRRNKDLRQPDNLLKYIDARIIDENMYYVLLDEIQLVPEFEDVLNSFLHVKNAEVFATGSNAKFLSKDIITEFRGRGWQIRVHPLSFSEYFEAAGGERAEALETYYLYGGLPGVAQLKTAGEKQAYLNEIFEIAYLRDVVERNNLHKADGLRALVRVLASGIGALTNPARIANTFKSVLGINMAASTISSYIECLKDAFIISEALRYDVKGRKYIGNGSKFYFEDLGILNAVLDFRQIEFNHSMENVIYNELRGLGYSVDVGQVEKYVRDEDGKARHSILEVDFVVNKHDERLYIQSAYSLPDKEKLLQEQASLLNIPDGFRKIIIAGDRYVSGYNEDGVYVAGIYDFLLRPNL